MFTTGNYGDVPSGYPEVSAINLLYLLPKAFVVSSVNNRVTGPQSSKQRIPYLLSPIKEHQCNLQK